MQWEILVIYENTKAINIYWILLFPLRHLIRILVILSEKKVHILKANIKIRLLCNNFEFVQSCHLKIVLFLLPCRDGRHVGGPAHPVLFFLIGWALYCLDWNNNGFVCVCFISTSFYSVKQHKLWEYIRRYKKQNIVYIINVTATCVLLFKNQFKFHFDSNLKIWSHYHTII